MSKKTKEKKSEKVQSEETVSRKQSHVELVSTENVEHKSISTGFEGLRFVHNALPEIAYSDIDTSTQFFGKHLGYPLLISSMTGGYEDALRINRELADVAAEYHLAIGVGSARQALETDTHHETYRVVRREYPEGLIFTNVGAPEVARLGNERKVKKLSKIVDLVEADALIIHLNPLQELMQPEGDPDFRGVLFGIELCVKELGLPIIVKEVGAGISQEVAKRLLEVGVRAIDVAGAGGTSWAGVEILRHKKKDRAALEPFWDWGISTVDALVEVAKLKEKITFGLIASGGILNGVDAAKSIALNADLVGIARPFLKALIEGGEEALHEKVETILSQFKQAMFLTGAQDLTALAKQSLHRI